jgi:pyruvate dehydrogenase E2 component (dihydrolipoamide acetyltransferase)
MDVIMPQLGETVTEGKVATWFKSVGDQVKAGDNLFEIETDKVTMEVQATESGILSEIRVGAGETVPVGTVVAVLGGAAAQPPRKNGAEAAPTKAAPRMLPFAEVRTPEKSFGPAAGPHGLKITPLARRLIAESGGDIAAIAESVRAKGGRRIAAADIKSAPVRVARPSAGAEIQPLNRIRAQTAARLAEAWRSIPHVFQAVEVDFSAVVRARDAAKKNFSDRHGVALTYLPFVARAVCLALADFARVNASFDKDRLHLHRDVNLGIAVDLAHEGLIVPVVQHADEMTAAGLAKAIARQVEKARTNKLTPGDLQAGTYTISNNGSFGTLFTTPIINPPQVAILSLDAVTKRAIVVETPQGDAIAARPMATLGQSFDHRAFDGAYSAAFLKRLKAIIETRDWASELA